MESQKMSKDLILKYLKYLMDSSEQLSGKYDLNNYDLENFKKEFDLFKERVERDREIDESFRESINSILFELKKNPRENTTKGLLKRFLIAIQGGLLGAFIKADYEMQKRKDIMIEFNNQISHIYFSIDKYKMLS